MSGNICKAHFPVQHRDGKPPWCAECGLTAGFLEPKTRSEIGREDVVPFSSPDEGVAYPEIAKEMVHAFVVMELHALGRHGTFGLNEVYVVWFAKTLKNWKALVSTSLPDGRYYEVTHNGEKDETYLDVYVKYANHVVHTDIHRQHADQQVIGTIRSYEFN